MKIRLKITAILAATALLCACAGNPAANGVNSPSSAPASSSQTDDTPAESRTLSIRTFGNYLFTQMDIDAFRTQHPGVTIRYDNREYENSESVGVYIDEMQKALAAGDAPDLFDTVGLSIAEHADWGRLANFYELIEADEDFVWGDYFESVFDAMSYRGGMYAFPLSFSFNFIAVNESFVNTQTEEFKRLETITYPGLYAMYRDMPNTAGFNIEPHFFPDNLLFYEIGKYINYAAGDCDFDNPDFINLFDLMKAAADAGPYDSDGMVYASNAFQPDADIAAKNVFNWHTLNDMQYFLPYEENHFTDSKPLADSCGRVIVRPQESYAISANSANKELAWAFLQFIAAGQGPMAGSYLTATSGSIPIHRGFAEKCIRADITNYINNSASYVDSTGDNVSITLGGDAATHAENVWLQWDKFCQLPMTTAFWLLSQEDFDSLVAAANAFLRGERTAAEAAADVQEQVSARLDRLPALD